MTKYNPAPSPSGHPLLSGPPTLNDIHHVFTTSILNTPGRDGALLADSRTAPCTGDSGMDHEHELAEEWHRKDVHPETVLLISLGALLGLGVCTQVVRQNTLPVVITLILMAVITLGSMVALQSSLPTTLSHGRPAYQSP